MTAYKKELFVAVGWTLFLSFFTYTPFFVELAKKDCLILNQFLAEQSKAIAFVVNVGIVIMLLLEHPLSEKRLNRNTIFIVLIIAVSFVIYWHAGLVVQNGHKMYVCPFSWHWFSVVGFLCFLIGVSLMKFQVLIINNEKKKE